MALEVRTVSDSRPPRQFNGGFVVCGFPRHRPWTVGPPPPQPLSFLEAQGVRFCSFHLGFQGFGA